VTEQRFIIGFFDGEEICPLKGSYLDDNDCSVFRWDKANTISLEELREPVLLRSPEIADE